MRTLNTWWACRQRRNTRRSWRMPLTTPPLSVCIPCAEPCSTSKDIVGPSIRRGCRTPSTTPSSRICIPWLFWPLEIVSKSILWLFSEVLCMCICSLKIRREILLFNHTATLYLAHTKKSSSVLGMQNMDIEEFWRCNFIFDDQGDVCSAYSQCCIVFHFILCCQANLIGAGFTGVWNYIYCMHFVFYYLKMQHMKKIMAIHF